MQSWGESKRLGSDGFIGCRQSSLAHLLGSGALLCVFLPLLTLGWCLGRENGGAKVAGVYPQLAAVVHQEPRELWLPAEDIVSSDACSSFSWSPLPSGCPADKHDPTSSIVFDDCSTSRLSIASSAHTHSPGRPSPDFSPISCECNHQSTRNVALYNRVCGTWPLWFQQMGETLFCDRTQHFSRSESRDQRHLRNSRVKHSDCLSAYTWSTPEHSSPQNRGCWDKARFVPGSAVHGRWFVISPKDPRISANWSSWLDGKV